MIVNGVIVGEPQVNVHLNKRHTKAFQFFTVNQSSKVFLMNAANPLSGEVNQTLIALLSIIKDTSTSLQLPLCRGSLLISITFCLVTLFLHVVQGIGSVDYD